MSWLSNMLNRPKTGKEVQNFVKSISIDTSGPEFADLYPTRAAIEEAIAKTGRFRASDLTWIVDIATERIGGGMNFRGAVQEVTRSGELLAADALKERELNARTKIGSRFADAVAVGGIKEAIAALDLALHTETSKANQLHNLRRMQKLGVKFCKFVGPGGDANMPLEAEMTGTRLSVEDAIDLVRSRASEIRRSTFAGEVAF